MQFHAEIECPSTIIEPRSSGFGSRAAPATPSGCSRAAAVGLSPAPLLVLRRAAAALPSGCPALVPGWCGVARAALHQCRQAAPAPAPGCCGVAPGCLAPLPSLWQGHAAPALLRAGLDLTPCTSSARSCDLIFYSPFYSTLIFFLLIGEGKKARERGRGGWEGPDENDGCRNSRDMGSALVSQFSCEKIH